MTKNNLISMLLKD